MRKSFLNFFKVTGALNEMSGPRIAREKTRSQVVFNLVFKSPGMSLRRGPTNAFTI